MKNMNDNPIIRELELSYTKPKYWWERTLPIGSKEWKVLRKVILERDNYTCRFCEIRLSKYLVVDHINGDATDNNLENLGVNCKACDTIRHCGLACIQNKLLVAISKLDQVEIVQKTHQFYLENKRVPFPKEIDKDCIIVENDYKAIEKGKAEYLSAFTIASDRYNNSNLKEELKDYKGFFTKEMKMNYLIFRI